jgi:hypothetical protein
MAQDGESVTHRMGFGRVPSAQGENDLAPGSPVFLQALAPGLATKIRNRNLRENFL